jgi:hypothetical protein
MKNAWDPHINLLVVFSPKYMKQFAHTLPFRILTGFSPLEIVCSKIFLPVQQIRSLRWMYPNLIEGDSISTYLDKKGYRSDGSVEKNQGRTPERFRKRIRSTVSSIIVM